jgi:DNA-binding MarR family transcriptional regulator
MDQIKDAFKKVKEDMDGLRKEMLQLSQEIKEIKQLIAEETPTNIPTNTSNLSSIPTDFTPFKAIKGQNMLISTGNEGVPTDKPTNQQTNQHIEIKGNSMENALKILNSLDSIKKEIRLKFKDLTEQEFLVFSTLYQLEEEIGNCDYKTLSERLNLSESSVRDYIGKLIKKGIPVEKIKIKNKNVRLFISKDLKKIASLPTILQLRDL